MIVCLPRWNRDCRGVLDAIQVSSATRKRCSGRRQGKDDPYLVGIPTSIQAYWEDQVMVEMDNQYNRWKGVGECGGSYQPIDSRSTQCQLVMKSVLVAPGG